MRRVPKIRAEIPVSGSVHYLLIRDCETFLAVFIVMLAIRYDPSVEAHSITNRLSLRTGAAARSPNPWEVTYAVFDQVREKLVAFAFLHRYLRNRNHQGSVTLIARSKEVSTTIAAAEAEICNTAS